MKIKDIEQIKEGILAGLTYEEISNSIGCHRKTVAYHVRRMREQGITLPVKRGRKLTKYEN